MPLGGQSVPQRSEAFVIPQAIAARQISDLAEKMNAYPGGQLGRLHTEKSMNYDFIAGSGHAISFEPVTGQVISAKSETIASVHQDADRIVHTPGSAQNIQVVPGQVHTTHTVKGTVWLETEEGKQTAVQMTDIDLPMLPGHLVTILRARPKGATWTQVIGAKNHNTDQGKVSILELETIKSWGLRHGLPWHINLAILAASSLSGGLAATTFATTVSDRMEALIVGTSVAFFVFLVIVGILNGIVGYRQASSLKASLEERRRQLLQDALDPAKLDRLFPPLPEADIGHQPRLPSFPKLSKFVWSFAVIASLAWIFQLVRIQEEARPRSSIHGESTQIAAAANAKHKAAAVQKAERQEPVEPVSALSEDNASQLARHHEIVSRGPSAAAMSAIEPEHRHGAESIAAAYTLYPAGQEDPFPKVVESLVGKRYVTPRYPMTPHDFTNLLRSLSLSVTSNTEASAEFLAQSLNRGKVVFLYGSHQSVIRVTGALRNSAGQIEQFLVYSAHAGDSDRMTPAEIAAAVSSHGVVLVLDPQRKG